MTQTSILLPYTYEGPDDLRIYSSGRGTDLYMKDGKVVLDGLAGSMNANLGHGNAVIAAAMHEQALGLTSLPSIAGDASYGVIALAEKLRRFIGAPDSLCLFSSSGSEATESAIAIIAKYWKNIGRPHKSKIASLAGSYHGCTLGALAITGRIDEHVDIGSFAPNLRISLPAWDPGDPTRVFNALGEVLETSGSGDIAAIFLEPIMGLAGMIPASIEDIRRVVETCKSNDILVVLDEALTGLGRTGCVTAADYYGVDYDLLLISKGLGCGFTPIAATIVSPSIAAVLQETVPALRHGHTASGNPLAAMVASVVLDELVVHDVTANARQMGEIFACRMSSELSKLGGAHSLRATGLCLAVETASPELARKARDNAFKLGLRVRAIEQNLIACPPLTISQDEMEKLIMLLTRALDVEQCQAAGQVGL